MHIYEVESEYGVIRYACADEGKKILIMGELVDRVAMSIYSKLEDFVEVDDATYIPPKEEPVTLSELQENQIALSKLNLSAYLEANPLFSTAKYEDGRYYTVNTEKQQQLTSKILMYQGYQTMGMDYELTWNDTGNICEPWTFEELFRLSCEIDMYVTPLVKMQQSIEVLIKNAETEGEVLCIDVTYSKENIEKYIHI